MSKVAYVTFKRTVVLLDVDEMDEESIIQEAVEVWNEQMELEDIMMDKDYVINVEVQEE